MYTTHHHYHREPKSELWPDEEIYNGQFPVRLVQVTGGNGLFSGIGRVRIPFLNNIQVMVEFTNIQVNELNQIYAGELRSIYNPDSKFLLNVQIAEIKYANLDSTLSIDLPKGDSDKSNSIEGNAHQSTDTDSSDLGDDQQLVIAENTYQQTDSSEVSQDSISVIVIHKPGGQINSDLNNQNSNNSSIGVVKIWCATDNKEYVDGDIIDIPFSSLEKFMAFQLRYYPKQTQTFLWSLVRNNIDLTPVVQNNDNTIDNFGCNMKGLYGDIKLKVKYDEKEIEVKINVIKKDFELTELKAVDGNNLKRVAKSNETLYLVDGNITKSSRKINYEILPTNNLDKNEYSDLDIVWFYDEQSTNKNLHQEFGSYTLQRNVKEERDPIKTSVKAGYPNSLIKSVEVEWIDENKINVQVIPPIIKEKVDYIFKNLEALKNITDRFKSKDLKLNPSVSIKGYQANDEDENSRHFKTIRYGSINAGVDVIYSVPLPAPYSFELSIPILEYSLGEIGAFIDIKAGVLVTGSLRYEKLDSEENFILKENTIGAIGTGGINFGAKIELLSDFKDAEIDFKAFGSTSISVVGNYVIRNDGEDDFDVIIYFDPLLATVSGKVKAKGHILFDNSVSYQLLERIQIYP